MSRVVITGASGFIAKHIVLRALNAGHDVVATLRSPGRAEEVRAAIRSGLADPAGLHRLGFATVDLEADAGWAEALQGAEALIHTASPFSAAQPKDADILIRPAVEGTRRALVAARAAGVRRVVLTSSVAAITGRGAGQGPGLFDENRWTDPDDPKVTPYARSKTLAERAAWDFVAAHPEMQLTAINPSLVMGPPLDSHYGTSVGLVARLLGGRDPMLPKIGFGIVDVRDVAEMHLCALERPEAVGQRIIASAGSLWFKQIAAAVAAEAPGRRVPLREAPNPLIRLLALFDPAIRTILPTLGTMDQFANDRARGILGISFVPAAEAVQATARVLVAQER